MQSTTSKKIKIYTDGSRFEDSCCSVCIVVDKKNYYGSLMTLAENEPVEVVEFKAINQAFEYLNVLNLDIERIDVYTDVKPFRKLYYDALKGKPATSVHDWKHLIELCGNREVAFHYFTAHQSVANPNITCDILGRLLSKFKDGGLV